MKKGFIGIFLLFGLFVCGCDDLKDALAFNRVTRTEQQGNISVRVCSYADAKATVEATNALGTEIEKYEKIDFKKMYKSAKHEFKSSELCNEKGKSVIPIVVKIDGSYMRKVAESQVLYWGVVNTDETGKRTKIANTIALTWDFSELGNGIFFYGSILTSYDIGNKILSNGKYKAVLYTKFYDSQAGKFSDKRLATWDFEII